jgi:hypothetical protein
MDLSVDVEPSPTRARPATPEATRDVLLALPFLILLFVQLAHHVMWRDELNALAIAWASPTISSLFWHIHHEGHPWLWYMMLWIPSRFTQSLLVLKVVQGLVSTAIILFVALRSPFRTWEKALVLAGYFFFFEYTVLARMYGVMLLMLVLYLWRRTTRPDRPIGCAVLLGLMASTDTLGIILSLALILEYAYTALAVRETAPLFSRRTAAWALGVYAIITAFAVWTAKPAKDVSWRTTGHPFAKAGSLLNLYKAFLRYTVFPFVPVQSPRSHIFWNPELHLRLWMYAPVALIVLWLLYRSFRGRRNLLLLTGATLVAGTLLGHLIYEGSERQFGVVFLAFFSSAWILRAAEPDAFLPAAVYLLLGISALSSVWVLIGSWERPFSNNRAAAAWIVRNHLEDMPFVAEQDTSAISVAETLHRPVYMIECSCVDTYLLFSSRRDNYTDAGAPARILQAEHFYHDQPLLFMTVRPMAASEASALQQEGFTIEPLASFYPAEELVENFYFYRLTLKQPGGES